MSIPTRCLQFASGMDKVAGLSRQWCTRLWQYPYLQVDMSNAGGPYAPGTEAVVYET